MTADRGFVQVALIAAGAVLALTDHNYAAGVSAALFIATWFL